MIGALLLTVALAAPSGGEVPTVERFSETAGFEHARVGELVERSSITVGLSPEFWGDPQTVADRVAWLAPALAAWNTAAGWELFVQVVDGPAEVTFTTDAETTCPPNAGACAWMTEQAYIGFDHCHVAFWPWYPTVDVVAHELGHCLGFVDVPVEQQTPDGYAGIMTHLRPWGMTPDNPFDRASLAEAGYRVAA